MQASLPLGVAATLLLAACGGPLTSPARQYLGTVTPEKTGPLCQPSKATATIRDGIIHFAPDEGTWILDGIVNPDGTLTADKSRSGAGNQSWDTVLEARWTPTTLTGTYKTPRCTFKVSLAGS